MGERQQVDGQGALFEASLPEEQARQLSDSELAVPNRSPEDRPVDRVIRDDSPARQDQTSSVLRDTETVVDMQDAHEAERQRVAQHRREERWGADYVEAAQQRGVNAAGRPPRWPSATERLLAEAVAKGAARRGEAPVDSITTADAVDLPGQSEPPSQEQYLPEEPLARPLSGQRDTALNTPEGIGRRAQILASEARHRRLQAARRIIGGTTADIPRQRRDDYDDDHH